MNRKEADKASKSARVLRQRRRSLARLEAAGAAGLRAPRVRVMPLLNV